MNYIKVLFTPFMLHRYFAYFLGARPTLLFLNLILKFQMSLFLLCFVMSIPISFRTTYVQGIQVMQQISPAHSTSLKKHWPKIQKYYFSEKE